MSLLSNAADKSDKPDKLSLYLEEGFKKRKKNHEIFHYGVVGFQEVDIFHQEFFISENDL